jgi:hypothetical protein
MSYDAKLTLASIPGTNQVAALLHQNQQCPALPLKWFERDSNHKVALVCAHAYTWGSRACRCGTFGTECSFRKLAGVAGLSADTVATYIGYREDAYLVGQCPFFSFSERQRIRRNSKFYPVDSGLRRAVVTKTGLDIGKDFEVNVYLTMR